MERPRILIISSSTINTGIPYIYDANIQSHSSYSPYISYILNVSNLSLDYYFKNYGGVCSLF